MARILALTGWGQPHNALAELLPEATHVNYAQSANVEDALAKIAGAAQSHDIIVGWSLGGQLAVQLLARNMAKPRALVLIGAPFQFVETPALKVGMNRLKFEKFRENYERDPKRTMRKSGELIAHSDTRPERIRAALARQSGEEILAAPWLSWLQWLDGFSCASLDFSGFPPTLLVHGDGDAIVAHAQSYQFAKVLPKSQLEIWQGCGHAPHWHDPERLRKLIKHV